MPATYYVATAHTGVPDTRITAADVIDLGERIAAHLARHKVIRAGGYDIELDEHRGWIRQPLLIRPVDFTIRREQQ